MPKESDKELLERLFLEGPPTEWYIGFGKEETGISRVTYSSGLRGLEEGKVGEHMDDWVHLTTNPPGEEDSQEFEAKVAIFLPEAEQFIIRVTGFSPRQIYS